MGQVLKELKDIKQYPFLRERVQQFYKEVINNIIIPILENNEVQPKTDLRAARAYDKQLRYASYYLDIKKPNLSERARIFHNELIECTTEKYAKALEQVQNGEFANFKISFSQFEEYDQQKLREYTYYFINEKFYGIFRECNFFQPLEVNRSTLKKQVQSIYYLAIILKKGSKFEEVIPLEIANKLDLVNKKFQVAMKNASKSNMRLLRYTVDKLNSFIGEFEALAIIDATTSQMFKE